MNPHRRPGIVTFTGRWFDAFNPQVADVCIEDIAHALALMNRFGGHTKRPYSVAQHSYLASKMAPEGLKFQALMHDAHEAYVLDMPSPLKRGLPDYCALEDAVERVVHQTFGLPAKLDPAVKVVDMRMMTTEAKAFGLEWWDWYPGTPPYPELADLEPWPWAKAEQRFLDRFRLLYG
jgi:hypothetical protein